VSGSEDFGDFLKTGGAIGKGLGESAFCEDSASPLIGRRIGNVRITDFIGAGGMGQVFLGVDERLHRKVAVKALSSGFRVSENATIRFHREARILSRLDHPSICRLYDLIDSSEPPCLLLEYLEGRTLGEVLGAVGEDEILDIGIQVAHALAAAHREGVIHRDLKPDNVMVMADGSAKVLDFGIGRLMEEICPEPATLPGTASRRVHYGDTPTVQGDIIGTPRYMSPEQALGEELTPATDVFSLGIVLYELFEAHSPYSTEDPLALLSTIPSAEIEPPPSASVPLRELIQRLVARDPMQRPTAAETAVLLQWIREAPGRKRRRTWAVAASVVIGLAVVGALVGGRILGEGLYRCRGLERHLQDIWDPGVRERLNAGFESVGNQETWDRLEPVLDNYGRKWLAMRKDMCESTWIRREQTSDLLDLQFACLDHRFQSMASLIAVLEENPKAAADHAIEAAHAFPSIEPCLNTGPLLSRVPLPEDPNFRERAKFFQRGVSRARTLNDLGQYSEGWAALNELSSEVDLLNHSVLSSEYNFVKALLLENLGEAPQADEALTESILEAQAGRDDRAAARAWIRLVWVRGVILADFDRIDETVAFAQAALDRLGDDPELKGDLAKHLGILESIGGDDHGAFDSSPHPIQSPSD